jgi:hypothetical protein
VEMGGGVGKLTDRQFLGMLGSQQQASLVYQSGSWKNVCPGGCGHALLAWYKSVENVAHRYFLGLGVGEGGGGTFSNVT